MVWDSPTHSRVAPREEVSGSSSVADLSAAVSPRTTSTADFPAENGGDGWESNPTPALKNQENFTPDSAPCCAIRHSLDLEVQTPNSSPSPSSEDTSKKSDALPRDS